MAHIVGRFVRRIVAACGRCLVGVSSGVPSGSPTTPLISSSPVGAGMVTSGTLRLLSRIQLSSSSGSTNNYHGDAE